MIFGNNLSGSLWWLENINIKNMIELFLSTSLELGFLINMTVKNKVNQLVFPFANKF